VPSAEFLQATVLDHNLPVACFRLLGHAGVTYSDGSVASMRFHNASPKLGRSVTHEIASECIYFSLGHAPGVEPPIENVHDGRRVEGDPSAIQDAGDIRGKYGSNLVVPHESNSTSDAVRSYQPGCAG